MTTVDIWVNKKLQVIGIIINNSWLHCSIDNLLNAVYDKQQLLGSYGHSPEVVLKGYSVISDQNFYHYTTVSFDSLDELLPLLSKQHPELFL